MQDLTKGSITGHLLRTTSFMLVVMVFQTLYFLVDLYWVGRLGKEAVAGVGLAGNLMFVVLAITQMLGVGTTALISHAVGRRRHEEAQRLFNQAHVLAAVVAVVFFVLAMWGRRRYANSLAADATTAGLAIAYLTWFIPAMALQFGMATMGAALRGTGNFKPGMVVQAATVIVNIVLAPVLMFGWLGSPAWGVSGAAVASLVAILVGNLWLISYFVRPSSYLRFLRHEWRPQLALWRRLLRIGLPTGVEFALMAAYMVIVYAVTRPFGAAAQAGFGVGLRIMQAGFMPVVALGASVAPVAGQNYGAGHADRVRATFSAAARLAIAVMGTFAVLSHIAPEAMVAFFSSDPDVVIIGRDYLVIVSWSYVASGLVFVGSSMFQAMGNTLPSLVTSCTRIAVVAIPAIVLSRLPGFELRWIWYLSVAAVTLQMGLTLLLLRREFRVRLAPLASRAA